MLSSPRRRRRFLWGAVVVAVAGGIATSMVVWPNTADKVYTEPTKVSGGGGGTGPPPLPEFVPLQGKRRAHALAAARTFIRTAVARKDVARSWPITHPDFRRGYTEREWATGDIPVVPYPVDVARWRLGSSTVEGIAFEVLLMPAAGTEVRPQVFDIQLAEVARGTDKHWAVTSWAPRAGGIGQQAPQVPERSAVARRPSDDRFEPALGTGWLLAPAALLVGLLLAIPAFLVGREWRSRRRGDRLYREHVARRDVEA
jgi:hypothetical protein